MNKAILERLQHVEQVHGVRVLFACESGSRAWGFASKDSDYDVRFIYRHPTDAYLGLRSPASTITDMEESPLDLHGWDLRKAGSLLVKSNPSLSEWFRSPTVYVKPTGNLERMSRLLEFFSNRTLSLHYLNLAKGTPFDKNVKKFMYYARALLCARFVAERRELPPVHFPALLQLSELPAWFVPEMMGLIRFKSEGSECDLFVPSLRMAEWLKSLREDLDSRSYEKDFAPDYGIVNGLVARELKGNDS